MNDSEVSEVPKDTKGSNDSNDSKLRAKMDSLIMRGMLYGTSFSTWYINPKNDTYTFRGPINLTHLTNDCIRDGKLGFVAISKDTTYLGISRQVSAERIKNLKDDYGLVRMHVSNPFHIFKLDKSNTSDALAILNAVPKMVAKSIRKEAKIISSGRKKGLFSGAAETKVITIDRR